MRDEGKLRESELVEPKGRPWALAYSTGQNRGRLLRMRWTGEYVPILFSRRDNARTAAVEHMRKTGRRTEPVRVRVVPEPEGK